ncbi:MAG: hypothetical protein ACK50J_25100 [Planctomyces sp.]
MQRVSDLTYVGTPGSKRLVLYQSSKQASCVIPSQAGIHDGALDSRLRGNDEPKIEV